MSLSIKLSSLSMNRPSLPTASLISSPKHVPASHKSVVRFGDATKVCKGLTYQDRYGASVVITNMNEKETPTSFDQLRAAHPRYTLSDAGPEGWTALAVAINHQSLDLICHILDQDPTLVNRGFFPHMYTPLICAAKHPNRAFALRLVKLLICRGAEINLASNGGIKTNTPLFVSAENATRSDVTKFLLLNGAAVYQKQLDYRLTGGVWSQDSTARAQQVLPNIAAAIEELWGIQCFKNATLHSARRVSFVSELPYDIRLKIAAFVG